MGVVLLTAGRVIGPSNPNSEKNSPYECGFEAFEDARMKFDVRYYLVAILFIIFDLEIAFLVPWAVVLDSDQSEQPLLAMGAVSVYFGYWISSTNGKKGRLSGNRRRTGRGVCHYQLPIS